MSATDGKLELRFYVPLKLGRGENNREVRGQRIGRIQAERLAVFWAWPRMAARAPNRNAAAGRSQVLAPVPLPCTVTFTRVAPGRGLDPEENLLGSCKAVKDELAAILGVDDRDPRVTWRYEQERGNWGLWVQVSATLAGPVVVAPKASMSAPRRKHSGDQQKKAPLAVRRGLDRKVAAFLGAKPAFIPPRRTA